MFQSTLTTHWLRQAVRVATVFGLVLSGTGIRPARAQEGLPGDRPDREGDVPLAALPLTGAALETALELPQAGPTLEGTQSLWGQVVFQSYRDRNWEIYTANDSFGNPRRLTTHTAADVQPQISRDGSRLAFVSNRAGNYDLYRTDLDGDPVVRLTTDAATDSNPIWSPDGTRLVFQSNRLGNYDVWIMNADGTGQTVLTAANPGYDGEPTWSPDGSQIAFISNRSGQTNMYALHVMNADGTQPRLLVDWPYSSRPAWSPEGDWIIFDGADGQGMQRILMFEVATQDLLIHSDNNYYSDIEAGSWGIRDEFYVTRIDYVVQNGTWYIAALTPYLYSVDNTLVEQALSGPFDGWPSWYSFDRMPPTSEGPIVWNAYQSENVNRLFVYAHDTHSTVDWYEIQKRVAPNGAWEPAGSGGCMTLPSHVGSCNTGPAGPITDYRVRAIDSMGNVEPWPTDPARWVRVYATTGLLEGAVTDVRGRPLAGVTVSASPTHEAAQVTSADGRYLFHLVDDGDYVVTATVAGDTSVQQKQYRHRVSNTDGYRVDFTLQGPVNTIVNGTFADGMNGWANAGDGVVSVASAPGSDGAHVLRLGGQGGPLTATISAVSQTVTVPAVLAEPTLSFAYQNFAGSATGAPLALTIAEAGSSAPATRLEYPTAWSWAPIWIDLTPWLGKTITLTFASVQQLENFPFESSIYELDDVALGSALRPLVTSIAPVTVPLAGGVLTLSGSGFASDTVVTIGGLPAVATQVDDGTLTASVPAGVALGPQPVVVADALGFAAQAPTGLVIGYALNLPNLVRYYPGEVERGYP